MFNYDSVRDIRAFLESRSMGMQKKFGQNFMINPSHRQRILNLIEGVSPGISNKQVWEIGPGMGAITRGLVDAGALVRVFEIDRGFVSALEELFAVELIEERITIVEGDAKKTLFSQDHQPALIAGNLPYNVGSAIIARLITGGLYNTPMVFTLQREVVERICAKPGDPEYGSFSILCQYAMDAENHGVIPAQAFYPAPEVQSGIVRLLPRAPEESAAAPFPRAGEMELLDSSLRLFFASRRKTLHNNIKKAADRPTADDYRSALRAAGIEPTARAETLSPESMRRIIASLISNC